MKISSKLIITTATGVIGLIAVAIISYHQITQIHKSTVNFADFIYPSVSTLDGIRNDVAEMKAITLQMIVDEGDDATFGTLVKEFERAKSDMLVLIKKYRDRLVRNETDQALLDSVEATAKIALDNLNLVARVVHKHDITTATEFWYTIDENLDSLSSAIKKLRNYNDSFVEKSYIEANIAYDSSLMLSLITSGIIALLMSVMTIWSYKSLIDPLKTLEIKLDEISHSFNLQKRLEINSTY
jgi:CHASE3 domain sensor protein